MSASYILSQVLGSLILHVSQQGVSTCLTQGGRDAAEAPACRQVQGRAAIEHAGIHPGACLEEELHQTPLLGLHGQVQRCLPTGALLQGEKDVSQGPQRRHASKKRGPVPRPWAPQLSDGLPHLHINVSSVLKQQFHEWPVPLQGGDVETGQT